MKQTELSDCVLCGGPVSRRTLTLPVDVGARKSVEVTRRLQQCRSCAEIYFAAGELDELNRAANDVIRQREGLLTPEEIRALRTELGLSQSALERVLRVGPKTVVRWERGTVFQNRATDTLLRMIRDVPAARAYLLASLAPSPC